MHSALTVSAALVLLAFGSNAAEAALTYAEPARYQQNCDAEVPRDDLTIQIEKTRFDGSQIELTIVAACLDLSTYSRPQAQHWNVIPTFAAADSGVSYIQEIIVELDGGNWIMPVSAYGDLLFNVDLSVEIIESGPGVTVRLIGGGSEMGEWIATLRFEGGALVERYVTTSTFPDVAFESTQYGRPTDN